MEPPAATDDDIRAARRLVRAADHAALGTVGADGAPFVSLAAIATDHRGQPLLLLSELAEHTRNLARDPRVSLLVEDSAQPANPQTKARCTLAGTCTAVDEAGLRDRYLARHPAAEMYADFADFALYRVAVSAVHYVAGFGKAFSLTAEQVLVAPDAAEALAAAEPVLRAEFGTAPALDPESLAGLDADGADLRHGKRVRRLAFDRPADSPEDLRQRLAALLGGGVR